MTIDGKKETALYVTCGMYRHAYDRLVMVQQMAKDDPGSPQTERMKDEAIRNLIRKKEDLRKALDNSEGGEE